MNTKITYRITGNYDESIPDNNFEPGTESIVCGEGYTFGDYLNDRLDNIVNEETGGTYCAREDDECEGLYWITEIITYVGEITEEEIAEIRRMNGEIDDTYTASDGVTRTMVAIRTGEAYMVTSEKPTEEEPTEEPRSDYEDTDDEGMEM